MQDYRFRPKKKSKLPLLLFIVGLIAILFIASYLIPESGESGIPDRTENGTLDIKLPGQTHLILTSPEAPADRNNTVEVVEKVPSGTEAVKLAETEAKQEEVVPTPTIQYKIVSHTISKGDNLAKIFKQFGLSPGLLHKITHSSKTAAKLADINIGQNIEITLEDNSNKLLQLVHKKSAIESLVIKATDDDFTANIETKPLIAKQVQNSGTITESLFLDGQNAGLSDKIIMELVEIFGWDIDFALEIRKGDRFNVIYEENYLDNSKYSDGHILAAEFINQGNTHRAFRYTNPKGVSDYYDEKGGSMHKAFLRTPVNFSRISSRFSRKRWHPKLKKWRSHKGVDYAAPTGTPIKSTGNGKVIFRGWKGGYGRVVFVQHYNKYVTVYGHMSRFRKSVKNGSSVKQGQVIGYVGSSGLATGPHLHYEMRINGVHRNPLKVKLPTAIPLNKKYINDYKKSIQPLMAELDGINSSHNVALNDNG